MNVEERELCLFAVILAAPFIYHIAATADSFADIGTRVWGLPMWTEDQQLPRNPLGLQRQIWDCEGTRPHRLSSYWLLCLSSVW